MDAPKRTFDFSRDTFAFRNELVWEYLIDDQTGSVTTRKNVPPPAYAHHCFVIVRAAKQFYLHARFDPSRPECSEAEYAKKIREVKSRHLLLASPEDDRILFPGYECLREFSTSCERLLKANMGQKWESYVNRRHWRMIFPFPKRAIAAEAAHLIAQIRKGRTPVVHVFRFPELTINHAILLYGMEQTAYGATFTTYDPNLPGAPSKLHYFANDPHFELPRNIYWGGGMVKVYETYTGNKFFRAS